jgi:hypothetical protein
MTNDQCPMTKEFPISKIPIWEFAPVRLLGILEFGILWDLVICNLSFFQLIP